MDKLVNNDYRDSFSALIDLIPDSVVILDANGIVVAANKMAGKYTGFDSKELVGKHFSRFFDLQQISGLAENIKKRLSGVDIPPYEIKLTTKKGNLKCLEVIGNRVQHQGELLDLVIFHDVTERNKHKEMLQQTLVESEQKFRNLAEQSPNMIFIFQNGKIVYANNECERILGYTKEQFYSPDFNFNNLIAPEYKKFAQKNFCNNLNGMGFEPYFVQEISKDGRRIDVAINTNIIEYNGQPALLKIVTNVTELRKAQENIFQSEERLKLILEAVNEGVWDWDLSSEKAFFSQNCFTMFGYNPNDFQQDQPTLRSLVHHSDVVPMEKAISEAIAKNKSYNLELRMQTKAGDWRWILACGKTMGCDSQGKPTRVVGTIRDITEQKLMKQEVLENEEKFHTIANAVKDAIILVDDEHKVTYWNPAAEVLFGFSSEEVLGIDVHELVVLNTLHKEENLPIDDEVKAFVQNGTGKLTSGTVEMTGRRKGGSLFPFSLSISPVKLGKNRSIVGVVKDITKRKQYEQAIKEAEQRYRALFEEAPLGVLVIDPETTAFIEFNDVAHRQLGYTREEFSKLTIPEIEVKETSDQVKSHIAQILRDGVAEYETEHCTKNGEVKNVLVSVKTIGFANKKFLQCIFHDITEIKKIQNDLINSEMRFRKLVEIAQEGVWVIDKYYRTTFVNPRMAQILGYSVSEIMEKSVFDLIDQKDVEIAKNFLRENSMIGHFEFEFPRKDGSRVYASVAASQIKDDTGQVIGSLSLIADITERKKMMNMLEKYSRGLEEQVEQRTNQLAEAQAQLVKSERLAAIGELAGMVGHDLRNPLTGIKNAVYYLNKNGVTITGKEKQASEMLQTIDRCIEHSNKIITDLLDYSRELHLNKKESSLRRLLEESLSMLEISEKIEILNYLPEELYLRVDFDKIKRVFTNLIKNAIDAMPDGGKLTISGKKNPDNLQIIFVDTGIGIPQEILPKLFLPLLTTKAKGMGFGLAICKRIVDAHGGKIDVETVEGKGTTFTITLPFESKIELDDTKVLINLADSFSPFLKRSVNSNTL